MEFKKPDLHKPRLRLDKPKTALVSKEFLKYYLKKNPEAEIRTVTKMREVMARFHEEVANIISTTRDGFELPMIGYIVVASCDRPHKKNSEGMYDFKKSAELNAGVKHINFDTDMKLCKILFTLYPIKYKFTLSKLWCFKATKRFRKIVSTNYKKNYQIFFELKRYMKVSSLFRNI